ncbi:hypothetical protein ACHAW5_000089 [Stephanodiscus triporus]|uniref:Cation/H+ exchanger transmembrane domain-containing protein n=1 Tax=Stephanodiscus triporus TaxID=2934178 RepID=A0ABD3R3Y0_9STRA
MKFSGGRAPYGGGGGGRPEAASTTPKKNAAARSDRRMERIDERFRDYLVRTNVDVIAVGILLACCHVRAVRAESSAGGSNEGRDASEEVAFEEGERAVYALLFPWFVEIVGVFVYFFLSRYAHAIPYTAIMFIVGVFIGLSANELTNAITFSAQTWAGIPGQLILLVFLPGLLFLDSYDLDIHLVTQTFKQLIWFAFPMMLAGTYLTALVAYYILPYGWSFDLCMTFGSMLAATDPVAVGVLMNELGAPPRLQVHIAGESIMNDGSAAVFYQIFSARFFYEMGIKGFGEDVGWGAGFEKFFRLAFGGTCIGVAFGLGLLVVLFSLNRRLSGGDSVVQVVATIATAYLSFFASEVLANCSGIIAVFACGVTTKAFGETLYNDTHLFHQFREITEFLLNSLLFTLIGCVWAFVVAHEADVKSNEFSGWTHFGYLIVLFILLNIIRFFLIYASYPLISKIEIGTNWQEAFFMSYGGLRGPVAISLALTLYAEVDHVISHEANESIALEYSKYANVQFAMVGGIAFLFLVINGPTSGPLLKGLGLATPTENRNNIVEKYRRNVAQQTLKDADYEKLVAAVKNHKKTSPSDSYKQPNLKSVLPYLYEPGDRTVRELGIDVGQPIMAQPHRTELMKNRRLSIQDMTLSTGNRDFVYNLQPDSSSFLEERVIFINVLRSAYYNMTECGELDVRGFIGHSLFQSVNYAEDAALQGLPLSDWNALKVASNSWALPAERLIRRLVNLQDRVKRRHVDSNLDFFTVSLLVRQILAFKGAHEWARKNFEKAFSKCGEDQLTEAEKVVLDESDEQVRLADEALSKFDTGDVTMVTSHYACQILLNRAASYLTKLEEHGLMTDREAGTFLDEIQMNISQLFRYHEVDDQMSDHRKSIILSALPTEMLQTWNLVDAANNMSKKKASPESGIDKGQG